MKKVLVLYYSQTGQLKRVLESFIAELSDEEICVEYRAIKPKKAYPFPWSFYDFFDEFPEAVDPKSRNEILDSIVNYKKLSITVVYTSHYMNEIERICDEVAIIDKGTLIKQAKLDELLSNRASDKVLVETIYNEKLSLLGVKLLDATTIENSQKELVELLHILEQNKVFIKQIRYGSTNLEKYFLEVTA